MVMTSWPADSPISVGLGVAALIIALFGAVLWTNPRFFYFTRPSDRAVRRDKEFGGVVFCVGFPLALVGLFISWKRSNNERYAFLGD